MYGLYYEPYKLYHRQGSFINRKLPSIEIYLSRCVLFISLLWINDVEMGLHANSSKYCKHTTEKKNCVYIDVEFWNQVIRSGHKISQHALLNALVSITRTQIHWLESHGSILASIAISVAQPILISSIFHIVWAHYRLHSAHSECTFSTK